MIADPEENLGRWAPYRIVNGKKEYLGRMGNKPDDQFTHMTRSHAELEASIKWPDDEVGAEMITI